MQAPATKEEKDRRETLQTDISNIESIMNMVKEYIEAPAVQIRVLKSLLSNANVSTDVLGALQAMQMTSVLSLLSVLLTNQSLML